MGLNLNPQVFLNIGGSECTNTDKKLSLKFICSPAGWREGERERSEDKERQECVSEREREIQAKCMRLGQTVAAMNFWITSAYSPKYVIKS